MVKLSEFLKLYIRVLANIWKKSVVADKNFRIVKMKKN